MALFTLLTAQCLSSSQISSKEVNRFQLVRCRMLQFSVCHIVAPTSLAQALFGSCPSATLLLFFHLLSPHPRFSSTQAYAALLKAHLDGLRKREKRVKKEDRSQRKAAKAVI